jgi:vacuolar protein sorting-associated protein 11
VDIYDSTNKLVAFHVLLSPGHKALRAVGITRQACSSAIVFTSGGSIVTLTEKTVEEKISLLVQKNLYAAAISMAYADPSFPPGDITALYRRHAEHLYRKGDYSAAMDQYIYTIGSLESAHVIFRYLDAPKISMLARYLEELRERDMATPVHNELLRTCYLKLNDNVAAEKIAASASRSTDTASIVSSLAHNPKEALASVCSLQAPQAAEALVVHGAALARALPRETAGIVVSLCVGTYSPDALQEASGETVVAKMLEYGVVVGGVHDHGPRVCTPYPVHLFASAFVESPKVLRLILAHCNRNKCPLTPSLRRTLLELTLSEWNDAKRTGDTEAEKLRRKEAITVC